MIRFPRILGGGPSTNKQPADGWDVELQAMQGMAEWLATIPSPEGQFRALSYLMWRLKSGEAPKIDEWVESIAEQSAVTVARQHGFKEGVE